LLLIYYKKESRISHFFEEMSEDTNDQRSETVPWYCCCFSPHTHTYSTHHDILLVFNIQHSTKRTFRL